MTQGTLNPNAVLKYLAANYLLHRSAEVKNGERILVHGSGGGVGHGIATVGQRERVRDVPNGIQAQT